MNLCSPLEIRLIKPLNILPGGPGGPISPFEPGGPSVPVTEYT